MEIIKSLSQIKDKKGIVITIGNFDGVHKGHRNLLENIKKVCQANNNVFVLMTFVPHPKQILNPTDNFLINLYDERRDLLESCDVDYLCEIPFTRDFSTQKPEEFLDNFISIDSRVKKMYIGYDFTFGANKAGDFHLISQHYKNKNIEVEVGEKYTVSGEHISSSKIRSDVKGGNILSANKLLARNFYVKGRVIKGAGRGKMIGFPTANLQYSHERLIPRMGVYFTLAEWKENKFMSITNVGKNPTFGALNDINIETHILDFSSDIYGEELKVSFVNYHRDEKKFANANELIDQIKRDVENRKKFT